SRPVLDPHPATVRLDDTARDREPHPRTRRRAGVLARADAVELLEDALARLCGYARPRVLDREEDGIGPVGARRYANRRVLRRVLRGVVDDRVEGFGHRATVGVNGRHARLDADVDGLPPRRAGGALDGVRDDGF